MPRKRPVAILFDVYQTLFTNRTEGWQETFVEICREQQLPLDGPELWRRWKICEVNFRKTRTNMDDPSDNPRFKPYEMAWAECFKTVFEEGGIDGDAESAARRSVEHMSRCDPFPETVDSIRALEGRVRLAVFSNADDAFLRPLLAGFGLPFEAVESSESAGVYKPHPDSYTFVLDRLGIQPEDSWYVGDHLWDDIYGASRIGMTTVWINRYGSKFDGPARPDIEIKSLAELPGLIDGAG